jgi:1-acyl-sn-glycerol-3-phosphate acyltransferase
VIAAPRTSNRDLPYMLMIAFQLRLHVRWMGKASIFSPPSQGEMMWPVGIPVQLGQSSNLVAISADAIKAVRGLTPNRTRKHLFTTLR